MGVPDQKSVAIPGDGPREQFIIGLIGGHGGDGITSRLAVNCLSVYKEMGWRVCVILESVSYRRRSRTKKAAYVVWNSDLIRRSKNRICGSIG